MAPRLLRTGEMAARLQCSVSTLHRLKDLRLLVPPAFIHPRKHGFLRWNPEETQRQLDNAGLFR